MVENGRFIRIRIEFPDQRKGTATGVKSKREIMSLFRNGHQMDNNSSHILVSNVNGSDNVDVSDFDPIIVDTFRDVIICSDVHNTINHVASPFGLPVSNRKNIMI